MEPLVFDDLTPIECSVTLAKKNFILVEASEQVVSRYRNAQLKSTKVIESADGSKQASIEGISDTEVLLVSLCLFEMMPEGTRKTVDPNYLKSLPHRIIKPLFDRAEEISGLKTKDTIPELRKKLKETQDKLSKLEKEQNKEEGTVKNS